MLNKTLQLDIVKKFLNGSLTDTSKLSDLTRGLLFLCACEANQYEKLVNLLYEGVTLTNSHVIWCVTRLEHDSFSVFWMLVSRYFQRKNKTQLVTYFSQVLKEVCLRQDNIKISILRDIFSIYDFYPSELEFVCSVFNFSGRYECVNFLLDQFSFDQKFLCDLYKTTKYDQVKEKIKMVNPRVPIRALI